MAIIRYSYDTMLSIANTLDAKLPSLLEEGNWDIIRNTLVIPESIWAGQAADNYARVCKALCDIHSKRILDIPQSLIRDSVESMKERERRAIEAANALSF